MYFASDYILLCRGVGNRLASEDLCGLTLLIFSHVNPYGTFKLDMNACIPLEANEASEVPLKSHLELQKSFLAYLAFAASDKDN